MASRRLSTTREGTIIDAAARLLFRRLGSALLDLVLRELRAADASASIHLLLAVHLARRRCDGLARRLALLRGRLGGATGRRLLGRLLRLLLGLLLAHGNQLVERHVHLLLYVRHFAARTTVSRN